MEHFLESRRLQIGAHQVCIDDDNRDAPCLFALHGIPGWRGTFRPVRAALAGRLRLIAPDLLGFGESSAAPPGFHAQAQAEVMAQAIERCGPREVHLLGFDFGGPTAIALAGLLPKRIASLTLIATNVFPDTPIPAPLRVASVPGLGALAFRLFFGRPGLWLMWRMAARDRAAFPAERFRETLRFSSGVAETRRLFLQSLRDLSALYAPIEAGLRSFRKRSLVLWGDCDPFFAVEVGHRTAGACGASLQVLPGCGHFVPEERPGAVAESVLALVAATRAPTGP